MSWIGGTGDFNGDVLKAAQELQRNLKMNAENKIIEEQGRLKQTNIYNEAKALADQGIEDIFTPSEEARRTMDDAHIQKMKQEIYKNIVEINREFLGQSRDFLASQGGTLPATLTSGTSAAMSLIRRPGFGARGAAGFASAELIAAVTSIAIFCYIITVFSLALKRVAANNRKLRKELEEARLKALLDWESKQNMPSRPSPFVLVMRPRVAR